MTNEAIKKVVDLKATHYTNSTSIFRYGGISFTLWDVVKTALQARLNVGLGGGAGMGKSQLFADVRGLVGNNSNYVLGRNDLDIKTLFRKLNFSHYLMR